MRGPPHEGRRGDAMKWKEDYRDDEITGLVAEARYHLGRVLCEGELDFDRAVSELEEALRLDPENIRAHYFLGRAIREQVERNKFTRATEVLRRYLLEGAPLGHEGEVRLFLGSRKHGGTTNPFGGAGVSGLPVSAPPPRPRRVPGDFNGGST